MAQAKVESKKITITGDYAFSAPNRRALLDTIIVGSPGRLKAIDEDIQVYLEVIPTSSPVLSDNPVMQDYQFELHVSYPFWRSIEQQSCKFTFYRSLFRFPKSFSNIVQWRISERVLNIISNIHNDGSVDTGFTAIFRAVTDVRSPELLYINTQQKIKMVDHFVLKAGDELIITTYDNRKTVILRKNGIEENAFRFLHDDHVFFQLHPGDNLMRYGAGDNFQGLEVIITYETTLAGI